MRSTHIAGVIAAMATLILSGLGGYVLPVYKSQIAYAHTFSPSESAQFLSLAEQIKAEAALVVTNLENNNVTLAKVHAEKASSLLDNSAMDELSERNERVANTLSAVLAQLEGNATSLPAQGQVQQSTVLQANQTVMMLNDILGEATTVRVETNQRDNATTWAAVLANLTNVALSEYGNATGSPLDLTNMSNMQGMADLQVNRTMNMTMDQGTMAMKSNQSMVQATDDGTRIVNMASYQSAQYLANNTLMEIFNNSLRSSNSSIENRTAGAPLANQASSTAQINDLEKGLVELRDSIGMKATPGDVMMIVHTKIHPLLIQIYGLNSE